MIPHVFFSLVLIHTISYITVKVAHMDVTKFRSFDHLCMLKLSLTQLTSVHSESTRPHLQSLQVAFFVRKILPQIPKTIQVFEVPGFAFPQISMIFTEFSRQRAWNLEHEEHYIKNHTSKFHVRCEIIFHLPHDMQSASQNCVLDDANVKLMTVTCRLPPPCF